MRSKPSKAEAPPAKTKATEQPVIYDKEHGGADSRDHHAVEIESGASRVRSLPGGPK